MVQMTLANNIANQGCEVTFFSDIAASLDPLVDSYTIKPFPNRESLLDTIKTFDLCLYDSSGAYVRSMPKQAEEWCLENAVCYRMSDAPPRHTSIKVETLKNRLPTNSPISAAQFKFLNASLRGRYRSLYRPPVVQQLVNFLKSVAGFESVTLNNGLNAGVRKKQPKKVLIHPTSSNQRKNWPSDKFVNLVKELQTKGYDPIVTVAPNERQTWLKLCGEITEVPLFESIKDLAEFYRDAALFIGNDSGNGHLASALGVPTIQMFMGWKKSPAWRAGWAENTVITARFPFNLFKSKWAEGVTISDVMNEVTKISNEKIGE